MENRQVQPLTARRAIDATQGLVATRARGASCVQTPAGSAANASPIAGIPGAAFTSKWYRHPDRLTSPSKRPPS
jgi:hypothetical protein